ncbi:hypothetical protein BT63DRAFT_452572 [Microthyrium microscopicum]|uniref:Uncharacterized protein n=1 Tax=Microthyrium microscopicum TaxID=703497 RepID=A0A6A6UKU7_9PEZI|nr:hypothetical protein BT63DRAFT_452572 [Microthyrium microscopicum]
MHTPALMGEKRGRLEMEEDEQNENTAVQLPSTTYARRKRVRIEQPPPPKIEVFPEVKYDYWQQKPLDTLLLSDYLLGDDIGP